MISSQYWYYILKERLGSYLHSTLEIRDFRNTSQIYLRMSGRNGNLERTGCQVSTSKHFWKKDRSPCVKETSYFNFGCSYLPNLNFSFCRKWKLHSLRSVLVCCYSFITPHKSISPNWSYSSSVSHRSVIRRWERWGCRHIYIYIYIYIYDIRLLKLNPTSSVPSSSSFTVYLWSPAYTLSNKNPIMLALSSDIALCMFGIFP